MGIPKRLYYEIILSIIMTCPTVYPAAALQSGQNYHKARQFFPVVYVSKITVYTHLTLV